MRQSKKLIILEITNTVQNEDPVTSNLKLAPVIKIATPEHLHPIIRNLFTKCIPNVPLVIKLPHYTKTREKLPRIKQFYLF